MCETKEGVTLRDKKDAVASLYLEFSTTDLIEMIIDSMTDEEINDLYREMQEE